MESTGTTDVDDRQEMAKLAAGDATALDRLMDRHAQRLHHYLLRLLPDGADAEDLAQETFVRVFRHAQRFDPTHAFSTWLFTIATNLVRDRLRRLARHHPVSLEAPLNEEGSTWCDLVPVDELSPADQAVRQERAEAVRRSIAQLPDELRVPLVLAEYESLSQAQIAAVTGGSLKAVEMRLYRARQFLRERLSRCLGG